MDKKKKQNKKIEPKKINQNKKPLTQRPRSKITTSKPKATPESKLSDLENTLDLNIQILKTFYQNSTPVQTLLKNDAAIIEAIDKIKKQYLKKKELFKQLKEKKSKSLIESQIYTEKKRKLEEMKDVYQDKIGENEEGLNGKDEVIKKVQKRLKEVEVYIHKLTLNMIDKKRRQYYQSFLINDFLDVNNELARQKDLMTKKVENIRSELQATQNENKIIKNKNNEEKTNFESEIKINETKNTNDEKVKDLSQKYEFKIEIMTSRINLLKNALEKMNEKFHLFDINKLIKKNTQSINLNIGKEEENKNKIKSNNNNNNNKNNNNNQFFKKINVKKKNVERDLDKNKFDIDDSLNNTGKFGDDDFNNRLNSFLDFSVLNNKEDEVNISKEKFGTIRNSIWDLSAINVKDISFIEKKE
jgi:hypothetical protein